MTTKPNDGGPAFPGGPTGGEYRGEDGYVYHQFSPSTGMSLRQWYAGMAMQGLLSNPTIGLEPTTDTIPAVVKQSFNIADAMLSEGKE